jgi:hypothetical protein
MVALAVAEFGRVPLASAIFNKYKLIQGIAVVGIVALGYLAAENWTFGFERIVDLRLKSVNAASRELSRADADLAVLVERFQSSNHMGCSKRPQPWMESQGCNCGVSWNRSSSRASQANDDY